MGSRKDLSLLLPESAGSAFCRHLHVVFPVSLSPLLSLIRTPVTVFRANMGDPRYASGHAEFHLQRFFF